MHSIYRRRCRRHHHHHHHHTDMETPLSCFCIYYRLARKHKSNIATSEPGAVS